MSRLKEANGTEKAIIAMCRLQALPGDSGYDRRKGAALKCDGVFENQVDKGRVLRFMEAVHQFREK